MNLCLGNSFWKIDFPDNKGDSHCGWCLCFTDCEQGRWGLDCAQACQCEHGVCDPVTGYCTCNAGKRAWCLWSLSILCLLFNVDMFIDQKVSNFASWLWLLIVAQVVDCAVCIPTWNYEIQGIVGRSATRCVRWERSGWTARERAPVSTTAPVITSTGGAPALLDTRDHCKFAE